jgi:hypothetical protein
MKTLQDAFDAQLQKALSLPKIGAKIIAKRFQDQGVVLTDEEIAAVERRLQDVKGDKLTIQLDDDQVPVNRDGSSIHIQLDNLEHDLKEYADQFGDKLEEAIPEIVRKTSKLLLKSLKNSAPPMLKERRKVKRSFEANVNRIWGKPLNLLEMHLVIALEAGEDFNREYRPKAVQDNDLVFEVLTRLHARACQIGSEILVLLRTGHADGAHSRWRSLHEIAVIGFFVKSNGNDTAEQYLLHEVIESFKAARDYQTYCDALGYEPFTDYDLDQFRSKYQHLIGRFGSSYREEYGWAANALGNSRPTFRDIERAVKLDHWRPFYRMASHNVHANPKGAFFKLGLLPERGDVLLAGPSLIGLADPGHGTAIALTQTTAALLTTRPNLDRLVTCEVLAQLDQDIGEAFLLVHKSLQAERAA